MELRAHETDGGGWYWEISGEVSDDDGTIHHVEYGRSRAEFVSETAALDNAKHVALGILDALASETIGTTEETEPK